MQRPPFTAARCKRNFGQRRRDRTIGVYRGDKVADEVWWRRVALPHTPRAGTGTVFLEIFYMGNEQREQFRIDRIVDGGLGLFGSVDQVLQRATKRSGPAVWADSSCEIMNSA